MAIRSFKIGECAIGGIIRVNVGNTMITISTLDYYTKSVVLKNTFIFTEISYWGMKDFLNEITSSYYVGQVMDYIEKESGIKKQLFRN